MSRRLDFRRFVRLDTLKSIDASNLRRFLTEVGGPYVADQVELGADPLPYDEIAKVLGSPAAEYPDGLVDALYHARDFASDRNAYDELWEAAFGSAQRDLFASALPPADNGARAKRTAEDLVVELWLDPRGRELVQDIHAQHCTASPRSFESFFPPADAAEVAGRFDDGAVKAMVHDLDAYFEKRRNARGVRVIPVTKGKARWFIVRQPAPWERRVYVAPGGGDEMKQGHPEDYDVLIYHPSRQELSVHAKSKGDTAEYRAVFGRQVFGDAARFSEAGRVSLEPLRALGRKSIRCSDVEGIDDVTLVEVEFVWRNDVGDRVTRKSKDLFVTFGRYSMPRGFIRYAVFNVLFAGDKAARKVRIFAGARSSYAREAGHDCIKDWLVRRGFLRLQGRVPSEGMQDLWQAFVDRADDVLSHDEWDAVLGGAAGPAASFLELTDASAPTTPCGIGPGQGCRRLLVESTDGSISYGCGDTPTRCKTISSNKVASVGYRLSLEALADTLATALRTGTPPVALSEPDLRLWSLGARSIGTSSVGFWLAQSVEEAAVAAAVRAIRGTGDGVHLRCLLVPSCGGLPARSLRAAAEDGVTLLGLNEVASVIEGALAVDLWPIVHRHRRVLRDVDPTVYAGDRFDLILDARGERYWYGGHPFGFGPREKPARLLLRALASAPGAGVTFEQLQQANSDVIPATSRGSWAGYKQKLLKAMRRKRKKAAPPVPSEIIESLPGGAYVLRVPPARVYWFSADPGDEQSMI